MLESFEIVSIDGKISVYYYKDGTLEIQGSDTNPTFRRIVKKTNGLASKKDYIWFTQGNVQNKNVIPIHICNLLHD